MNNQEINKIHNLVTRYHIENTKENFERLKLLIKQKKNYCTVKFLVWLIIAEELKKLPKILLLKLIQRNMVIWWHQ